MISPDGLTVLRFDCLFEQLGNEGKLGSVDLRLFDIVVRKGGGQAGFVPVVAEAGHCASYDRSS